MENERAEFEEIENEVEKLMKKNKKLSYADALKKVMQNQERETKYAKSFDKKERSRSDIIYALAAYAHPSWYHQILGWHTESLRILLQYYEKPEEKVPETFQWPFGYRAIKDGEEKDTASMQYPPSFIGKDTIRMLAKEHGKFMRVGIDWAAKSGDKTIVSFVIPDIDNIPKQGIRADIIIFDEAKK